MSDMLFFLLLVSSRPELPDISALMPKIRRINLIFYQAHPWRGIRHPFRLFLPFVFGFDDAGQRCGGLGDGADQLGCGCVDDGEKLRKQGITGR